MKRRNEKNWNLPIFTQKWIIQSSVLCMSAGIVSFKINHSEFQSSDCVFCEWKKQKQKKNIDDKSSKSDSNELTSG